MPLQSEAALENGLIATLQQMSYEYVQIDEEKNLYSNFKRQLEKHNKKRLEDFGRSAFTEAEFEKILITWKEVPVLKKPKNCATCIRLNWKAVNGCG